MKDLKGKLMNAQQISDMYIIIEKHKVTLDYIDANLF